MSYYTDLNVLPTASMSDIKEAYEILMQNEDMHLDYKIKYNKAYATLYDYTSRRKYDNLMEEENKTITAYNNKNKYLDISNLDNNNNEDDNLEENLINEINLNNNDILDHIDKCFSKLNSRLENIEKRLYQKDSNNNSFYKERKKINTYYSKGKKVVNILTDVNRDGKFSSKLKTISYDSDGNEEVTYKKINKKKNNEKDLKNI
jgi:DnaJ-class molecular chaperone